ncbi:MAG: ribonuclease H [Candidatus Doudnabacteria bacterium CG10_big_fil_rev_8_21_14_0_10_42_18]|uniref:Ribonuclease H n=1 Tax=Candidatus Doudnabacteria bacterium CG10_big_fil_rev_8_21_14_0_10_42_18 TaxID=1974552 RepID=A0A2H0VB84_9BACT|nr:MAG: ribonuclease H [Candidatus Doudnabacteria bacterium CG10_big_fil_rev_8_21_14_0_10_42_18]
MNYTIFTDGGSRGNPGPAGVGVVVYDSENKIVGKYNGYIGRATNNVAEYKALVLALEKAALLPTPEKLTVNMDSELIVRQMNGQYKIKEPALKDLALKVFSLTKKFQSVIFNHVPREKNKLADKLVNIAIDEAI